MTINFFERAVELDPSSLEMKETLKFAREELEKDSFVPVPAEKVRIDAMIKWMREGGAIFDKLKIRYYAADNRGVHASRDIEKGETIL